MEEKLYYGNTVIGTIPVGWSKAKVNHKLVDNLSGFAYPRNKAVDIGVPHLRPFNIGTDGEVTITENTIYIPQNFRDNLENYYLLPGDILYNNTNSVEWVGKSAIVRESMTVAFSNHINRLRVKNPDLIDPRWLALSLYRLQSQKFFAIHCNKWIGQAGFGITALKKVEIPLPPLATQRRIVSYVEALFADLREMRVLNQKIQEDAESLVQSVLTQLLNENSKELF